jgi:hypothetical protein
MTWLAGCKSSSWSLRCDVADRRNVLVAQHHRRMGKSPWSGFQAFAFPFKDLNAKEWLTLFALAVFSPSFGAAFGRG